jgi:hypothetical protein
MFDFVSIVFNDKTEIELLKLQLYSFQFVDETIVNNIFILFNDNPELNKSFQEKFETEILCFVPLYFQKKTKVICVSELIDTSTNVYVSNWFTQQFAKLYISKIIQSQYYIVLDGKNAFIKPVTKHTFFDKNNKIYMYKATHNEAMINYYNNCFEYFKIKPRNPYRLPCYILTTTPWVFNTVLCNHLIDAVEKQEKRDFYTFFMTEKKYTEFFFYFAWTCFLKSDDYVFLDRPIDNVIVGGHDPKVHLWNSWESKFGFICHWNPSLFSIHRRSMSFIDAEYKNNIFEFLSNIYKNEKINQLLRGFLLDT